MAVPVLQPTRKLPARAGIQGWPRAQRTSVKVLLGGVRDRGASCARTGQATERLAESSRRVRRGHPYTRPETSVRFDQTAVGSDLDAFELLEGVVGHVEHCLVAMGLQSPKQDSDVLIDALAYLDLRIKVRARVLVGEGARTPSRSKSDHKMGHVGRLGRVADEGRVELCCELQVSDCRRNHENIWSCPQAASLAGDWGAVDREIECDPSLSAHRALA